MAGAGAESRATTGNATFALGGFTAGDSGELVVAEGDDGNTGDTVADESCRGDWASACGVALGVFAELLASTTVPPGAGGDTPAGRNATYASTPTTTAIGAIQRVTPRLVRAGIAAASG